MPCRGESDDYPRIDPEDLKKLRNIEAILCGILTLLEQNATARFNFVLNNLDYKEIGVSRQWLEKWWTIHKRHDAERRAREAADAERKKLRAKGLKKLSPKERKALGLEYTDVDDTEDDEEARCTSTS